MARTWRRLGLYASMVRYGRAHSDDFAKENYDFFEFLRQDLQPYIGDLKEKRAIDIGCGKSMWLTLLLHSYGASVTGIDTESTESGHGPSKYVEIAKSDGIERSLRTLAWDLLFANRYYSALQSLSPFPLDLKTLDTRQLSITESDFEAGTFDLAVSHEVFEHIADIDAAARSLSRIMKPDGVTYIYIHNYTSLSGGHHIEWKYPDREPSIKVPPWDHLRDNRFSVIPSWINRLRMNEYKESFDRYFSIHEWKIGQREGEDLLTTELRDELADYSDEELLSKGFTVIASPR